MKFQFNETRTVIEDISHGTNREYSIGENSHLTLVLIHRNATSDAEIVVRLIASQSHVSVIGFIIGTQQDVVRLHTTQLHEAPNTTSNLLIKSVLHDQAKFYFHGDIRVDPKAQKTDAYQRNENVMLSDFAHAESKPSLEILANDVRCTHGATIGSLPHDQLWYLTTRGIAEEHGKQLLIEGFFEQAISKISDTIVQKEIRNRLWEIL